MTRLTATGAAVLAAAAVALGVTISAAPKASEHLAAPFVLVSSLAAAGAALATAAALD